MGDTWAHWLFLVGTHLARSAYETLGQTDLRTEISHLRVEVHRARDLVKDYNSVLEACERELYWLSISGKSFAVGNIVLGILLLILWLVYKWPRRRGQLSFVAPAPQYPGGGALAVAARPGPRRPSDFRAE